MTDSALDGSTAHTGSVASNLKISEREK